MHSGGGHVALRLPVGRGYRQPNLPSRGGRAQCRGAPCERRAPLRERHRVAEHGVAGARVSLPSSRCAVRAGDTVRGGEGLKPSSVVPRVSGACPPEET